MSLAVCKAGAAEKGVPLYRHIADLAGHKDVILPVPVSQSVAQVAHEPPECQQHCQLSRNRGPILRSDLIFAGL